jgi:hypothetical protein
MRLIVIGVLMCATLAAAPAIVEGSVTNGMTGAGIKKAVVTLRTADNGGAYQTVSDGSGHFQFDDAAPGEYQVSAEAQGFVREPRAYVASRRLTVASGQRVKDLAVRLTPLSTISGRVLDENGDAIVGADVYAMRYRFQAAGKELIRGEATTTNQRGEYRLFDVEPGPWLLKVHKRLIPPTATGRVHGALPEMDYPDSYHPGARTPAEAEALLVAPGAQLTDIDLRLRKVRVFHVRGKVSGTAPVNIRDVDDGWTVRVKPDGTFDIAGFPPGRYRLVSESGAGRSAIREVMVEKRDVDGVAFQIEPAIEITGAVEGVTEKLDQFRLWLEPVGIASGNRNTQIQANGAFTLAGLAPQAYNVSVRTPDGMYLKSVRLGTEDISGTAVVNVVPGAGPLIIGFASDVGSVTGVALSSTASAVPVYVSIAPTGAFAGRADRVQFTQVEDAGGAFELYDTPPGEYRVLACETADASITESAEFRKFFEGRSEAVTVRAGEHPSVRLHVISAAEVEDARSRLR